MDDERDVVVAKYTCDYGYELNGEAEVVCDLDTETWQAPPPSCQKGMKDVALLMFIVFGYRSMKQ